LLAALAGRRLHGRRGLKLITGIADDVPLPSPPSRAAWIEMPTAAARIATA